MKRLYFLMFGVGLVAGSSLLASQNFYTGTNVTGQLVLARTVNVLQQAQLAQAQGALHVSVAATTEKSKVAPRLHPPVLRRLSSQALQTTSSMQTTLMVSPTTGSFGFNGLTHFDQRNASQGNQFSVEPPSQNLAVANGFVVEGVNNAFQVYTTAGTALLPTVLSTNQVFGLAPAIDRATGINGPFPTDMRVFYDQTIDRFFVMQRAQDNDAAGNPLPSSHLYLAVSQTGDPTGTYNIYTMDTTNTGHFGCPCIADFPEIGADQFGIYISANEFDTGFFFVDATILAISKASFAAGASLPTAVRFVIPLNTGFEFAIQPAVTPPGASYFLANGGLEYFVSSQASFAFDTNLALWGMSNTSSLGTSSPNLMLTQTTVPTLAYSAPDVATQHPGPLPYGSSLTPPGVLALLDGGDTRIQSATYAGGRLWVTLATQVVDGMGHRLVGAAYIIFSPTFRSGVLNAPVLRQGILLVSNNHLLRPAIGVTAQGKGAIICTLVGPDYFPSAAFVPVDLFSTAATIQIAGAGVFPEDGFSGYPGFGSQGVARWGDYSAAVAASDGSIWMATEYIPNAPRTTLANWGTRVIVYRPQ